MPAEMKSIFLFFVCVQIFVGIVHSAAIVNDTDEKLCKLCNASCLMLQSGEKHDDVAFGDTWSYSCASSRPQDDAEFDVREIDQGTIVVAGEEDEVYYISKFIDSSKNGKHLHVHVRDGHPDHHDHSHLEEFDHKPEHPSKTRADAMLNVVHPKVQNEEREEM
jgi:hypothetical protein